MTWSNLEDILIYQIYYFLQITQIFNSILEGYKNDKTFETIIRAVTP